MKKDNKQVAIIERGEDGRYSVYIENKNYRSCGQKVGWICPSFSLMDK